MGSAFSSLCGGGASDSKGQRLGGATHHHLEDDGPDPSDPIPVSQAKSTGGAREPGQEGRDARIKAAEERQKAAQKRGVTAGGGKLAAKAEENRTKKGSAGPDGQPGVPDEVRRWD